MGATEVDLESPDIAQVSHKFLSNLHHNIVVKEKCMLKNVFEYVRSTLLSLA